MSAYKFLANNKLIIDRSPYIATAEYECAWNRAEWKIDIKTIDRKDGASGEQRQFAEWIVDVLESEPIGYGNVIVLLAGRMVANVVLKN